MKDRCIYRVAKKSKLLTQYNSLLFWATLYSFLTRLMSPRFEANGVVRRARDLSVVVGAHRNIERRHSCQKRHRVRRSVVHGYYSRQTWRYDIALLQLKNGIRFNDRARPICLDDTVFPPETECVVTGWGFMSKPTSGMYVVIIISIRIVREVHSEP